MTERAGGVDEVQQRLARSRRASAADIRWNVSKHTAELAIGRARTIRERSSRSAKEATAEAGEDDCSERWSVVGRR